MQKHPPNQGVWTQPPHRQAMLAAAQALPAQARASRLAIPFGQPDHVDDEVVVALLLDARRNGGADEGAFAMVVLRRTARHVRAHVRKNPRWPSLGGGVDATSDDFCQDIVVAILTDSNSPCHAEVAFGNYVWKRCLDQAAKLTAKKHSAGQSFDESLGGFEDLSASQLSTEDEFVEFEDELRRKSLVEKARQIIQCDLPEQLQVAITLRYFGGMKIESTKSSEASISTILGVTEKTASKYIRQAVEIIRERLDQ